MRSWWRRKPSMIPLMPSPGSPKTVSTPQSMRRSTRSSEAIFFMARTPSFGGRVGKGPKRTSSSVPYRRIDGHTDAPGRGGAVGGGSGGHPGGRRRHPGRARRRDPRAADPGEDRKSTRLNSSHVKISYAVFCLKKKKKVDVAGCWRYVWVGLGGV